ncbi:MAG: hypothetical protein U0941_11495 [Planctomycetaceae bacterium]
MNARRSSIEVSAIAPFDKAQAKAHPEDGSAGASPPLSGPKVQQFVQPSPFGLGSPGSHPLYAS